MDFSGGRHVGRLGHVPVNVALIEEGRLTFVCVQLRMICSNIVNMSLVHP